MALSGEDKEILADFLNEAQEGLEKAEVWLLQMEELLTAGQAVPEELIDSLFRVFHSIKGSAGFLNLRLINQLTHHAESLLDHLRKKGIRPQKAHSDILFETIDALTQIFDVVRQKFQEPKSEGHFEDLLKRLTTLGQPTQTEATPATTPVSKSETMSTTEHQTVRFKELEITDDLIEQFAEDSLELLDQLEQELLQLEKSPNDKEILNSVFRSLHSLKGNAGFFNYKDISEIAHQAETVFDFARQQQLQLSSKQISLILKILDFLRAAIGGLLQKKAPTIPGKLGLIDLLKAMIPEKLKPDKQKTPPQNANQSTSGELLKKLENLSVPQPSSKLNEVVRVDVSKLDRLMELVGEIVIAESMISQYSYFSSFESEEWAQAFSYLQRNVRELQDLATSLRLIPLNGLFGKMKRLVRDISLKKEKQVELQVFGGETEVDRSVIEHISDPLVHILRNAIDHGIESAEERKAKGKPQQGQIILRASRVGGEIWIEIQDDGRGLDREKILKRAVERGLIAQNTKELSDDEIYNLIFMPGFSTADRVTNISGRGVGMDVVKKNVEKIRGHVAVKSSDGHGTTIRLKIPLTTAIIDAMLLRVHQTVYAIPMLDIRESLKVQPQQVVDLVDGQEVIKVRDEIIPVIRLQQLHSNLGEVEPIDQGVVVITQAQERAIGFWVHEILGQQQLVIKPVPQYLGKLAGVSGCAILGDGTICLILDLAVLVSLAETQNA